MGQNKAGVSQTRHTVESKIKNKQGANQGRLQWGVKQDSVLRAWAANTRTHTRGEVVG